MHSYYYEYTCRSGSLISAASACIRWEPMWLGPDFDPDELADHGSRRRRRIRYAWQQTAAMVRLLAECGLPRRKFLPAVSDELLARCAAAADEGGIDARALSRRERRALTLMYEGAATYNSQFEEEEEMLDLVQFKQLVLGLWPAGAAADDEDGYESEEGEEGEWYESYEGEEGDPAGDDEGTFWGPSPFIRGANPVEAPNYYPSYWSSFYP